VLAEAVRIAYEARRASVIIDWSVSAKTPLEAEVRLDVIHQIELEEFADQRSSGCAMSWVALRIRQRLLEFDGTLFDQGSETTVGVDLLVTHNKWLNFYETELEKETEARHAHLRSHKYANNA
jgi:hypothetical protein